MPGIAWAAGQTETGFSLERMLAVALRRGGVRPPWWLSPVCLVLASAGLAWQLAVYRCRFRPSLRRGFLHWTLSLAVLALLSCVLGGLASLPLRAVFE